MQNYHEKTDKVALAIGGFFIKILVRMGQKKVHPQVKTFGFKALAKAKNWIYMN